MASTVRGAGAVEGPKRGGPSHPALERLVRRPWEGAGRAVWEQTPQGSPLEVSAP